MRTAARLTLRLYRFELVTVLVYGLLLAALAILVTVRLNAINPGIDCLKAWMSQGGTAPVGCESTSDFLGRSAAEGGKVMAAMWLLPIIAGLLAGAVLVAREIEHRTTQFAWTVGPSRRRWYLDRILPVLAVIVCAVVLPAIAAEFLEGARVPWIDPLASAGDFGLRGPIVVALAVAAFGVAVLTGALIGRMLPALIVATVIVVVIRTLVSGLVPFGEPVVPLDRDRVYSGLETPLIAWSGWKTPDGRILTQDEALVLAPAGSAQDAAYQWVASNFTDVPVGVAGRDVWRVELRESVLLLAIGTAGLLAGGGVVSRRRPY
jgi:hypothetical protein